MAIIGANVLKSLDIRQYACGFVSNIFARFYLIQNYFVSENDGFQMKNNEKKGGILSYVALF